MGESIRRERAFITILKFAGAKPRVRRKLLSNITLKQIKAFSELAYNSLFGILPISKRKKKLLRSIKPLIRFLASKKKSSCIIRNPQYHLGLGH